MKNCFKYLERISVHSLELLLSNCCSAMYMISSHYHTKRHTAAFMISRFRAFKINLSNEADDNNRRVTNTCRYQNCVEKGEQAMLRRQQAVFNIAATTTTNLKVYKRQLHKQQTNKGEGKKLTFTK